MKIQKHIWATLMLLVAFSSCNDFLEREPDTILTPDEIYTDPKLVLSVLANYYERVSWGIHIADWGAMNKMDEAVNNGIDGIVNFDRNWWRVYDYDLVRHINISIRDIKAAPETESVNKEQFIAEVRFIRAWHYFNVARSLGGMPLVGDTVFDDEYEVGMDITTIQVPRSSESEIYDYVISECKDIANTISDQWYINSSRINKWGVKMLEARAALFAGSLAKYNVPYSSQLTVEGDAVGIPASKADEYFKIALDAAKDIVENSPYQLQLRKEDDRARNFYEAVNIKDNNTEVIWARDYKSPGQTHGFTGANIPAVFGAGNAGAELGVLLNLVEEFEPIVTNTPGVKAPFNFGDLENPVFFDDPLEPFMDRDPRLQGTVILNGTTLRGTVISYQAGLLRKDAAGEWYKKDSIPGARDRNGILITSSNGPVRNGDRLLNKSGMSMFKYLDESANATSGIGSEIWNPRFRLAEAYLIAAEACVELGNGNAATYINPVRNRAGVQPLSTVTMENIRHERRVEFALEDHLFWDMKRWRLAHEVWNPENESSKRYGLFAYLVDAPGDPAHGKWFYEKTNMSFLYPNPLKFEMRNYYSEIENDWANRNPKMKRNPYQ